MVYMGWADARIFAGAGNWGGYMTFREVLLWWVGLGATYKFVRK